MAIRREEAFVLKRLSLRETSLLVTLFGRDAGKFKVLVKGARREKNPLVARFEPFTRLSVVYYETLKSDTHLASDTAVLDSNVFLRSRLDLFSYASYLTELVDALFEISDPHPDVFELLATSFSLFQEVPAVQVARAFEVKVLEKAGLVPVLTHCAFCGSFDFEETFFSPKQGGIICRKCDPKLTGTIPISQATAKRLLFLFDAQMEQAAKLSLDVQTNRELERICERFIQFRLEYPLRSTRFLAEVKPLLARL